MHQIVIEVFGYEYTMLDMSNDTTELDIVLALGCLFDQLSINNKKMMYKKLGKLTNLPPHHLIEK